jgi:gamma-glutamyltranspeptidase/glutathione hydrolase
MTQVSNTLIGSIILTALLFLSACQNDKTDLITTGLKTPEQVKPVSGKKHMVAVGHPLAAKTSLEVLRRGGSALDAAIAAEMVLTLVEPQSSGIGGGGFLVHYSKKTGAIDTYDGRETAPNSANPYMFLDVAGKPLKWGAASIGGLGVGVPGLLRMLELAHKEHGKLDWSDLFQPAIKLAKKGFPISKRLARQIKSAKWLSKNPVSSAYFFNKDGSPKKAGSILKNPSLADTLTRVANNGAMVFYSGDIAKDIANTVSQAPMRPGKMKVSDLETYVAKKRPPVCLPYRSWLICGMGPPSSGGITTLQIMGILRKFDFRDIKFETDDGAIKAIHLLSEASSLAFADRNFYIGDPDFVKVPTSELLDREYLSLRSYEIDLNNALGRRKPGTPGKGVKNYFPIPDGEIETKGLSTTHLSIIDSKGNAISMTASIERAFGSHLMVRGFLLNNQLTDFNFKPNVGGLSHVNQARSGKRPRSSMSPTLVFDGNGKIVMAIGSPGGSHIIGYVTKTLIAALDWNLDIQKAIDFPNITNRNGPLYIEKGSRFDRLIPDLKTIGHQVLPLTSKSGLNGILLSKDGLQGGSDSRREGIALAD